MKYLKDFTYNKVILRESLFNKYALSDKNSEYITDLLMRKFPIAAAHNSDLLEFYNTTDKAIKASSAYKHINHVNLAFLINNKSNNKENNNEFIEINLSVYMSVGICKVTTIKDLKNIIDYNFSEYTFEFKDLDNILTIVSNISKIIVNNNLVLNDDTIKEIKKYLEKQI